MLEIFPSIRAKEEVERIKPIWDVLADYVMYFLLVISALTTLWQYDLEGMIRCVATPIDSTVPGVMSNQTNDVNSCVSSKPQMVNILTQTKLIHQNRMVQLLDDCRLMALFLVLGSAFCLLLNNVWYRFPGVVAKTETLFGILLKLEGIEDKSESKNVLEDAGKLIRHSRSLQSQGLSANGQRDESSNHQSDEESQQGGGTSAVCSEEPRATTSDAEGMQNQGVSTDGVRVQIPSEDVENVTEGAIDETLFTDETSPLQNQEQRATVTENSVRSQQRQSGLEEQTIPRLQRELMRRMPMMELTNIQKLIEVNRSVQGLKKSMNGKKQYQYLVLMGFRVLLIASILGVNAKLIYSIYTEKWEKKYDFPDDYLNKRCNIDCSLKVERMLKGIYTSVIALFSVLLILCVGGLIMACCQSCLVCGVKTRRFFCFCSDHRKEYDIPRDFAFFWYLFQRRKPCALDFVCISWMRKESTQDEANNQEQRQDEASIHKEVERLVRTNIHYCKENLLTCENDMGTEVYKIDAPKCGLPSSLFLPKVDSVKWRLNIVGLDQLKRVDFAGLDSFKNLIGLEIRSCHRVDLPNIQLSSLKSLDVCDFHAEEMCHIVTERKEEQQHGLYIQVPVLKSLALNHVRPLSFVSLDVEKLTTLRIENTTIVNMGFIKRLPCITTFSLDKISFAQDPWSDTTGLLLVLNSAEKLSSLAVTSSGVENFPKLTSKSLERIDLSHNKIKIVDEELEKLSVTALKFLDLKDNNIDTLGELLPKKIDRMCEIKLSQNPLTYYPLSDISLQFAFASSCDQAKDCLQLRKWNGVDIEDTELVFPSFRPKREYNSVVIYYCDIVHAKARSIIILYLACLCQLFYQGRCGLDGSSYNVYGAQEFKDIDLDEDKTYKDVKVFMGLKASKEPYLKVTELGEKLKKMKIENNAQIDTFCDTEKTVEMTENDFKVVWANLKSAISNANIRANILDVYPNIDSSSLLKIKALHFKGGAQT